MTKRKKWGRTGKGKEVYLSPLSAEGRLIVYDLAHDDHEIASAPCHQNQDIFNFANNSPPLILCTNEDGSNTIRGEVYSICIPSGECNRPLHSQMACNLSCNTHSEVQK